MRDGIVSYLLALCLALSMIAGSVVTGIAQGRPDPRSMPLTQLVICDTDGGMSVISVDGSGNRVDPDRHCEALPCQNCMSAVAFDLPPVSPVFSAAGTAIRARLTLRHVNLRSRTVVFRTARGPPVEV